MAKLFGPPSASWDVVDENLALRGVADLFRDEIAPLVWAAATAYHIDPVGAVAQSLKETGAGKFGGAIDARWLNTCGLKVRTPGIHPELSGDKPLAHAMFPSWQTGAIAQAQHIRAYGGWPIPPGDVLVDPRYIWVIGKHKCTDWSNLGGKWAPSATYGVQIEQIMTELSQWR